MADSIPLADAAKDQRHIWAALTKALGAELRPDETIRGQSGLDHKVQALAVDDKAGRVIIVAAEANARTAALMQVDVQATMPDARVLMARPVIFDLADISRRLISPLPITSVNLTEVTSFFESVNAMDEPSRNQLMDAYTSPVIQPFAAILRRVTLPTMTQILDVVDQASQLPWEQILAALKGGGDRIDLAGLTAFDNLDLDRKSGVCPIPLYEFSEGDWDSFLSGKDIDAVRERLKRLGVFQYFFPPSDQLALGLADRGIVSERQLTALVERAPIMGHPFGDAELVAAPANLIETLEALKDAGYLAEGEVGVEVTDRGQTVRSSLKFRPRESLLAKILNRFSVNLSASPKDLLGP